MCGCDRHALRIAHTGLGNGDQPTGGDSRGQRFSFADGERGTEDTAPRQVQHHCHLGEGHVSPNAQTL